MGYRAIAGLWACLLLIPPAAGDEVILRNDDRLTGEVKRLTDGRLTIGTDMAGDVTIDVANIRTFQTDQPVEIHLRDGTMIHRRIMADDEGRIGIEEDDLLAAQTFRLQDIRTINPPPVRWTGDASLGLAVARGNADTEQAHLRLEMVRRSEIDRITLGGSYRYGRQRDPDNGDRTTTQNNWSLNGKYDYFFTERLYGYVNMRAERDRIARLDLRLAPGVGVGYQWIETPRTTFSTEGGLTWIYESFLDDTPTRRTVAARLAYDLGHRLSDRARIFHSTEYFPSLERIDDYLIKSQVGIRSTLTTRMFTEFRIVLDYDSTPAAGAERLDVQYLASVGWSF
jgi:putative salt-induced outer membrane protein YdiY